MMRAGKHESIDAHSDCVCASVFGSTSSEKYAFYNSRGHIAHYIEREDRLPNENLSRLWDVNG